MDDITHEAVDEVLQRALERIKHAGSCYPIGLRRPVS